MMIDEGEGMAEEEALEGLEMADGAERSDDDHDILFLALFASPQQKMRATAGSCVCPAPVFACRLGS
jgi:hypothetical protein